MCVTAGTCALHTIVVVHSACRVDDAVAYNVHDVVPFDVLQYPLNIGVIIEHSEST